MFCQSAISRWRMRILHAHHAWMTPMTTAYQAQTYMQQSCMLSVHTTRHPGALTCKAFQGQLQSALLLPTLHVDSSVNPVIR